MMKSTQTGKYRYRPVLFFVLTYLFTWMFWIPAAFVPEEAGAPLMALGLIAPAAVSTVFVLRSGSKALKQDLKNKLVGFYKVKWANVFLAAGAFAVISCGIYLILYLGGASEAGLLEMRVFCASFGLTRALSAAAALTIPKARTGGMLRAETDASDKKALYAVLPEGLLFAALMLLADPARGGAALGAAAAAFCFYRRTALRTFGGTTGDLAGWFVQLAELAVLLTAVCCGLLL